MAGTIVANTINTDTGLFTTNNAYLGIAKAWVNFNGTSAAIRSSFNVSSVTRASAGVYTITFTTAMANANYSAVTGGTYLDDNTNRRNFLVTTQAFTTSSLAIYAADATSGSGLDMVIISVAIFSS
jgi:hypothetical protein